MEYTTETQLILNGLYRDRAELTKQLTDVERLIKKIKLGTFSFDNNAASIPEAVTEERRDNFRNGSQRWIGSPGAILFAAV